MSESLTAATLAARAVAEDLDRYSLAASSIHASAVAAAATAANAIEIWNARAQRDAMLAAASLHRGVMDSLRYIDVDSFERISQHAIARVADVRYREQAIAAAASTMHQIAKQEQRLTALEAAKREIIDRTTADRPPVAPPILSAPLQVEATIHAYETKIAVLNDRIEQLQARLEQQITLTTQASLVTISGQSGENRFDAVANTISITNHYHYYYGTNAPSANDGES